MCLWPSVSQVLTSQSLQLDVLMATVSQSGIDITEFAARCAYGHSQSGIYITEFAARCAYGHSQSGIDITE